MARASKVEPCILCDAMPCECNKPAAKPKKPVAPKKPVVKLDLPKTSHPDAAPGSGEEAVQFKPQERSAFAAMKAKAKPLPQAQPVVTVAEAQADAGVTPEESDAMFAQAVRALAPLLHPIERTKYSRIIDTPATVEERGLAWRARQRIT